MYELAISEQRPLRTHQEWHGRAWGTKLWHALHVCEGMSAS